MELNEYQEKAMRTCMDSSSNLSYQLLNLVGEVGELSSKVAKAIRKQRIYIDNNDLYVYTKSMKKMDKEIENEWKAELGDIAWQLAGLCHVLGWKLDDVCQANLDKLSYRDSRGVIDGSGDNR